MSKLTLKEKIKVFFDDRPKLLKVLQIVNKVLLAFMIVFTIAFVVLVSVILSGCSSNKVLAESPIESREMYPTPSDNDMPYFYDMFSEGTVVFAYSMYGDVYSDVWGFGLPNANLSLFPENAEIIDIPYNLTDQYYDAGFLLNSYPVYRSIVYNFTDYSFPFENLMYDIDYYFSGYTFHVYRIAEISGLASSLPLYIGNWNDLINFSVNTYPGNSYMIIAFYEGNLAYEEGYADGEELGYNQGYDDGSQVGYDIGYEDGYTQGLNASLDLSWLTFTVDQFLDYNFFGTFGVGDLLAVFISGWLLIIFLRIFAGG